MITERDQDIIVGLLDEGCTIQQIADHYGVRVSDIQAVLPPSGAFVRCDGCGSLVQLPCVLCRCLGKPRVSSSHVPEELTRKCIACNKTKPFTSFAASYDNVYIHYHVCTVCRERIEKEKYDTPSVNKDNKHE